MSEFKIDHDECSFLPSEIEHTDSECCHILFSAAIEVCKQFLLISTTKRRNWVYSWNCEPERLLPFEYVSTKFNLVNDE